MTNGPKSTRRATAASALLLAGHQPVTVPTGTIDWFAADDGEPAARCATCGETFRLGEAGSGGPVPPCRAEQIIWKEPLVAEIYAGIGAQIEEINSKAGHQIDVLLGLRQNILEMYAVVRGN